MARDLPWAFGDDGILPLAERAEALGATRVSLLANPLWTVGSPLAIETFYAGFLLSLVAVVLGLGGRWSLLVAWAGLVSLMNRNGIWSDGSDVVMRVFGAYLLLAPVAATWAVGRRSAGPPVAGWPLRLFQLQVVLLYVRTGLAKAFDARWQDGTAVHHALSTSYFWRFPMRDLLAQPWFHTGTVVATYATLAFEIGFPLVLVPRLRRPMLLAGIALHLGIALFCNLGGFSEAILWTYLAFVVFPPRPEPPPSA
jgi:hypothetical protein